LNVSVVVTLAGPLAAATSWLLGGTWLFWVGVAVCVLALFLNIASGAMKLPILPAVCMLLAALFLTPWYFGVGVGLVAWTTLDGLGEIYGIWKEGRLRRR
jgi:hypothetical protein